jgi:hypothetical protein
MGKSSGWVTIAGGFLMMLGLCFLPAAFSERSDVTILGAGICTFALGALTSAAGIYLKARALQSELKNPSAQKAQAKRIRGGCDLCGTDSPVIHCRVHALHICGSCVPNHYDFRSCVYIPSTRRSASSKPQARAARV